MTRSTTLLIALACFFSSLSAATIKGKILSDSDSTAIIGASCRLMSGDTFITSASSADDGTFQLTSGAKVPLSLIVSCIGYNPSEIVIESDRTTDIGSIYLSENTTLGEVQVTASTMTDYRGRTILFPSSADVKASSTSISLFQKLPFAGLEANPINRSLSVDGGTPVILINGIPSTITDLNALQPKDIEKIEYSRVTPARYADSGKTGFLNIVLKKRDDGGQVYFWGRSAVNTAFVDANLKASYHQGPSQFSLLYSPSWRNYQNVYDNTSESYIGDDFRVNLDEHDRAPFNYVLNNIRLKYDYSPRLNTLFSATFTADPSSDHRRSLAHTTDSYLGDYANTNNSSGKDFAPSLDLFFKRDFNDRNSLEIQVVGTLSSSDYRRSNRYTFADGSTNDYIMDVDSRRRSLISEISYTHQFSDKTSLSAGYQNTVSRSTNTYLSSDYKPILTENNNYAYARLGQQIGRLYLTLATGAKMYWIKNDLNKRNFIRNLTLAQLSWNISSNWNLSAAFQYTPSIPSLSALTDYPQQQSPYLISNGNPDLKVSEYFTYQLYPSFQYKKFSTSLFLFYRHISDYAISDMTYLGDNLFLSQTVNARKAWVTGSNLNLKISDIAGFGANLSLSVDHYEFSADNWSRHLTSFDASFTLWWNNGPYTISYWRKIPGKYLNGYRVGKEENGDALSFEYKPDRHWTIEASWMYMFDSKGTRYPAWSYSPVNPYTRDRHIKDNSNMIVLSVSYSADFGSIFKSSRRSLNNSDNGSSLLKL